MDPSTIHIVDDLISVPLYQPMNILCRQEPGGKDYKMKEVHTEKRRSRKPMDNTDLVELGKNIQKQRELLGMSQEGLGLDIGTNRNAIYLYETAQRVMKVDRLFDIADALMITPTELCPKRYVDEEKRDPRLYQIGEKMKKMDARKRDMAFQAIEAMVNGFLEIS